MRLLGLAERHFHLCNLSQALSSFTNLVSNFQSCSLRSNVPLKLCCAAFQLIRHTGRLSLNSPHYEVPDGRDYRGNRNYGSPYPVNDGESSGWNCPSIEESPGWDYVHSIEESTTHEDGTFQKVVSIDGKDVIVTVTKKGKAVEKWIRKQTLTQFGFDVEWRPDFGNCDLDSRVALLQLSTGTECLLVQMLYLDYIPETLVNFLKDPDIKLAGVGVKEDMEKLLRDHSLICKGSVELGELAAEVLEKNEYRSASLIKLAYSILSYKLKKPKSITLSNWALSSLSHEQIVYACKDAWISFSILLEVRRLSYDKINNIKHVGFVRIVS